MGGGSFQILRSGKSPPRSPPNPKFWPKSPPHSGGEHFLGRPPPAAENFHFPFENCQKSSKKPDFFRASGAKVLPPTMGGTFPNPDFGAPPHPSQSPPQNPESPPHYGGDSWGGVLPPSPSQMGGESPP